MRNEGVRFESARVYMPDARLEKKTTRKKKPTTTLTTGVRAVGRCHAPVMYKAGDLFGKFARQMQNGVCLDFALPAPKAKRRTLRGGGSRAPKKLCSRQVFLLITSTNLQCMCIRLSYGRLLIGQLVLYIQSGSLLTAIISSIARLRLFRASCCFLMALGLRSASRPKTLG